MKVKCTGTLNLSFGFETHHDKMTGGHNDKIDEVSRKIKEFAMTLPEVVAWHGYEVPTTTVDIPVNPNGKTYKYLKEIGTTL